MPPTNDKDRKKDMMPALQGTTQPRGNVLINQSKTDRMKYYI